MRAEVVGVGTELLLGQICNANAQWMSGRLADIGVDVVHHQAVGDNLDRIAASFTVALGRADVLLVTGGLGPTQDDITREGLSRALGIGLVRDPAIEEFLRERFRSLGRAMPDSNLRQADVPEGARPIMPERGTAPGLALVTDAGRRVYLVPGVPSEMREMMLGTILPELAAAAGPSALASRTVRVTGVAESRVAELLDDLFVGRANPSIAYLAGGGEVKVRVTAKASNRDEAESLIEPVADEVARRLGDHAFTTRDQDLADVVADLLASTGTTVACAESLTGGSLGARLSARPGASSYFRGSAVCYTARAKADVLGVSRETLEGPGAVSEECAREMAAGSRRIFDANLGLSTTGVAGPDAHDGKPVGTVCIGLAWDGESFARSFRAPGDREMVRRWAEQAALDLLRRRLAGLPGPSAR
ncbi:MAG: competence/damage-inducible protein A [Actinobacteria bacterium]|nr:MAG: competence/damage-inducible protein A [Actinomycetota bacterium]